MALHESGSIDRVFQKPSYEILTVVLIVYVAVQV